MPIFFADLVREQSWGTGTGAFPLGGALPGHRAFADAVPEGARFHYCIAGVSEPGEWETGEGEIAGNGTLIRSALSSSTGGASVDFSPGLKTVALVAAAAWYEQQEGVVPVSRGGTGAMTAESAQAALGLAIGSQVQSHSAILDTLATATGTTGSGNAVLSASPVFAGAVTFPGMMVSAAGLIGLGTNAPSRRIHILDTSANNRIRFEATDFSAPNAILDVGLDSGELFALRVRNSAGAAQRTPLAIDLANGLVGIGTAPTAALHIVGAKAGPAWSTAGIGLQIAAAAYTDTSSTAAAVVPTRVASSFGTPTFGATNSITVSNAITFYINAAPAAGANTTITSRAAEVMVRSVRRRPSSTASSLSPVARWTSAMRPSRNTS